MSGWFSLSNLTTVGKSHIAGMFKIVQLRMNGDIMSTDAGILEELREIRKLLTPAPKPESPKGIVNEFVAFISSYKVLGLAVAFILGIYIGHVVQAVVNSFIMPLVQVVYPPIGSGEITYVLSAGPILDSLITFVVVSFVVFIIVKIAVRMGID